MWAITSEERTKHDKQFDNLKPSGGCITGDQARTFFPTVRSAGPGFS